MQQIIHLQLEIKLPTFIYLHEELAGFSRYLLCHSHILSQSA